MSTLSFLFRRAFLVLSALLLAGPLFVRGADTTYVRYNTTLGPIDVQLLSDEAPHNVANFLGYVDSGAYAGSFVHRAFPSFIVQGGGFYIKSNTILPIPAHGAVINEFSVSNTRGTLAMAELGTDPNSATNQWYFNDVNNSAQLDVANGGYTVFGRIANNAGLAVMDALDAVPTFDASSLNSALTNLPLIDYTSGTNLQTSNFVFVNSIVREAAPTSATVTLSHLSATSNGAAQGVTVTTNPPNLGVIVTYNDSLFAPKSVGTYTVNAYINAPGYYGSATGTFVIGNAVSKTAATITLGGLTPGFDGKAHPATATTTPSGLAVTFTYNSATTPPTALGTYAVVATINDATYSGTATGNLVIAPALAPDSIAGLSITGVVAHGTGPVFATSGSFRLLPSASDDTYGIVALSGNVSNSHGTYSYSVTDAKDAVITYTDSSTGLVVTGNLVFKTATTGTYTLTTASSPASIETGSFTANNGQGPPAASGWSLKLNVADGVAPLASSGSATVNASNTDNTYQIVGQGGVGNSTGTYTYDLVAPSASSLILTDSLVGLETITLSWTSAKGGNYIAHDTTTGFQGGTFTATPPVAPTITSSLTATATMFSAFSYQITASGGVGTYVATGLPAGLVLDPATGIISGLPTVAGTFNVALTATNGNVGKATLVLTIPKATATVTLGGLTATYTGKGIAATATTLPEGLKTTLTYDAKTTLPTALGNHTVVATVSDANYTGTATGTLVISQGTATITFGNLSFQYTGKPIPVTVTTVPAALAVAITYNGSATAPTAIGSYPVQATITNPNYTGAASGTLIISSVLPTATTGLATQIEAKSATLNGTVNPKSESTSVVFEYGPTTAYGTTTSTQTLAAGTANVAVTAALTGLTPATLYHYRVVGSIGAGYTDGLDKTFTTLAAPTFASSPASYLGATGAELALGVNPNGVATSVYFQYSTSSSFSTFLTTAPQSIGSGKTQITVYALLSGLTPGVTYYYRMVTTSAAGSSTSTPVGSFTALGFETTLVAQKGEAATGTSTTFSTFDNPAVNESDTVTFAGTLTPATGVTAANNFGIWTIDDTNTQQLIAQIGSAAHGTTANFLTLSDPVFNNNGAVAFRGTLKVATGQATATTATGVWKGDSAANLTLVAQQGVTPVPGVSGGTFATFNSVGVTDSGGAVVVATLNNSAANGITAANNVGIWEGNSTSDLHLELRLGDTVGGKKIVSGTFLPTELYVNGQTRSFNSTSGNIAGGATFSDKTTGIVKVVSGTEQLVVVSGASATGVSGATFASFGSPAINTQDHIAFGAQLNIGTGQVSVDNNLGIWAHDTVNDQHVIARTGTGLAPGTSVTFSGFSDPVYNNNDAVAFRGLLKIGTNEATAANTAGIWCNSTGTVTLVARQGTTQAPGCPAGATFSGFSNLALPDQGGATNKGGVIFLGTLNTSTTAGVTTANNTGIWAVDSTGALQLIVRTGDVLDVNGSNKTVTALAFLPSLAYVNGQTRSYAQGNGDLVYLAMFSDKSTAIFSVVFP